MGIGLQVHAGAAAVGQAGIAGRCAGPAVADHGRVAGVVQAAAMSRVAVQVDGDALVADHPGIYRPVAAAAVLEIGLQVRAAAPAAGPARRAFVFTGAAVGRVAGEVHAAFGATELSGRAGLSADTPAALFVRLAGVSAFPAVLPVHLQKDALLPTFLHAAGTISQAHALVAGLVGLAVGFTVSAVVRVAGGIDAGVAAE